MNSQVGLHKSDMSAPYVLKNSKPVRSNSRLRSVQVYSWAMQVTGFQGWYAYALTISTACPTG